MSSAEKDRENEVLFIDLELSEADRDALRAARDPGFDSFDAYLRWLGTLPVDMDALDARPLPIGHKPFSLFDPPPVDEDGSS